MLQLKQHPEQYDAGFNVKRCRQYQFKDKILRENWCASITVVLT